MLIWRSWGILGILVPALTGGLTYGITDSTTLFALGMVAGAVAIFVVGWYLNQVQPVQKMSEWNAQRSFQLEQVVASGAFRLSPDLPPPGSYAEAQDQADYLLSEEQKQARKQLFNRSTIFFVPLQWFSIVIAAIGVIALIQG